MIELLTNVAFVCLGFFVLCIIVSMVAQAESRSRMPKVKYSNWMRRWM